MPDLTAAEVGQSWELFRRLAPDSTRSGRGRTRRRPARFWGIEALECRVVPATILVSSPADSGPNTLRAAITQADLDTTPDTIQFAPAVTGTITLVSALPDLSTAIDIEGPGPSVLTVARSSAPTTPEFRIFTVPAGAVVTISGLTISGGIVRDIGVGGGGVDNEGGGIFNAGTLTVTDSTLSGNSAGSSSDFGSSYGGGVYNTGTLAVTDSTISGNTASGGGGAGGGVYNAGTLTVTDSTLSGNTAGGGLGGGVFNTDALTVTKSISSIFFNPSGGNLVTQAGAAFVSGGHNLFSDTPAVTLAPTDLINTDPLLGPLADNGGPTFTQALLPGSPAIDAGVAVAGVTTNQRGVSRNQGSAPDIGAFESRGFTITIVGGDSQETLKSTAFAAPLVVHVTSAYGEPVKGGQVTFNAPMTGPSATLSYGLVFLDASGQAGVNATANDMCGSYTVSVQTAGAKSADFQLTNRIIPPTVVGLERVGIHQQPTQLILSFSKPLDPVSATNLHNYTLIPVGPKGRATHHPRPIRIKSAVYDPAAQAVRLSPQHRLNFHLYYRLTVNGSTPTGVASADGALLDGAYTGSPGSNYVAVATGSGRARSRRRGSIPQVRTARHITPRRLASKRESPPNRKPGKAPAAIGFVDLITANTHRNSPMFSRIVTSIRRPSRFSGQAFSAPIRPVRGVSRHRASRNPGIESLEGRVVPSTIPVTSLADAGPSTLRAAITQANLDTAQDTITFNPSVRGTIALVSALPDLSTAIDIEGPGPSVLTVARSSAPTTPEFRIFTVPAGAVVTISGLTISGGDLSQFSGGSGGGIFNAGTLTLTDSTLSGNTAFIGGRGGGIFNAGTLTLTDSTLSGNTTLIDGIGGGFYNTGTLTLTDSTLSGNSAPLGGGGVYNAGTLAVTRSISSIFFNSSGGELVDQAGGRFVSGGHNLFSDTPAVTLDPTDLLNTDPLLGPLADNGGPTFTQALLPGSPAIDAGVAVAGVTSDQRGIPRPQGSAPDIGAFESRGFILTIVGGDDQETQEHTAFPAPLVIHVTSAYGEPVAGGQVLFNAPATGPSATFTKNPVTLDASGQASVTATANGVGGSYAVSVAGSSGAEFQLTNRITPPTVVGLKRLGIHHQPTQLVLSFSKPLDPVSATNLHNYTLIRVGPQGRATHHPTPIPLKSAVYDPLAQAVRLSPQHRLNFHLYYRLTVNGSTPTGVASADGALLDGAHTGSPGSNYVAVVHRFGTSAIQATRLHPAGPHRAAHQARASSVKS